MEWLVVGGALHGGVGGWGVGASGGWLVDVVGGLAVLQRVWVIMGLVGGAIAWG